MFIVVHGLEIQGLAPLHSRITEANSFVCWGAEWIFFNSIITPIHSSICIYMYYVSPQVELMRERVTAGALRARVGVTVCTRENVEGNSYGTTHTADGLSSGFFTRWAHVPACSQKSEPESWLTKGACMVFQVVLRGMLILVFYSCFSIAQGRAYLDRQAFQGHLGNVSG